MYTRRELPVALLGDERTYARWIKANSIRDSSGKIAEFRSILSAAGQELSAAGVRNVQYVIKFLAELSKKSETTKMTQRNIAIVLAPTLLRPGDKGSEFIYSREDRDLKNKLPCRPSFSLILFFCDYPITDRESAIFLYRYT